MNAVAARPTLKLVHATPGRARLRILSNRADRSVLMELAEQLGAHPAVHEVRVNHSTGSLLILHTGELGEIMPLASELGRIEAPSSVHRTPMHVLQDVVDRMDWHILRETGGALSLADVAFFIHLAGGLWQARKGGLFFPAGLTMLRNALQTMTHDALERRESQNAAGKPDWLH